MTTSFNPRLLGVGIVALALVATPFVLSGQPYLVRIVTTALIYAIAAYGMNIILGLTGQLSLAHGAFFGIGAYVVGLLTTDRDWSFWASFALAILVTTALGYVSGLIALRTQGSYLAIFTMALAASFAFLAWRSQNRNPTPTPGMSSPSSRQFA